MHNTTHHGNNPAAGQAGSDNRQLRKVETLTKDMKQLLEKNDDMFDDEIICRQIDLLEHWMGCYRRNLVSLDTFCEASVSLLNDLRSSLQLAVEDLQRIEGSKSGEMVAALRRSEKSLSNIEDLNPNTHH